MNPFNLAPSCGKCNRNYKGEKDTLEDGKAFFPFSQENYQIHIHIEFDDIDWDNIDHEKIKISLSCEGKDQEIKSWKRLFEIEKRYLSVCSKRGKSNWFNRVLNEHHFIIQRKKTDLSKEDLLLAEIECAEADSWCDMGFLKAAFLRACIDDDILEWNDYCT